MSHLRLRDCARCGEQRPFEVPTCEEGHGVECPDLACVECGEALWIGFLDVRLIGPSAADAGHASAA